MTRCNLRRRHTSFLVAWAVLLAVPVVAGMGGPAAPIDVRVVQNTADRLVLDYTFSDPVITAVDIDGAKFDVFAYPGEPLSLEAGAPATPMICRSVIIPDDGRMAVTVTAAEYYEVAADVAPSKGNLLRTVDPAQVPYPFGAAYRTDDFYPGGLATLSEAFILRDYRGQTVRVYPVQVNPVRQLVRIYTSMTVELTRVGAGGVNTLAAHQHKQVSSASFERVYQHHFLNAPPATRYAELNEEGEMLIIVYDAWNANVQPLAAHRNASGIPTTVVNVSAIGNNSTAIKSYIQNLYNTSDLAFVLLVGDSAQVATPLTAGDATDPTYAKLAGSDNYPDILVGRFSAESAADVDTQVLRTIEYETTPASLQDWFKRATGIGSAEGAGIGDDGESDIQHENNIRTDLLGYGYTTVDQIYDPSASAAQVTSAVNAGRGLINYTGHGSTTSWSTTGFSSSNVNALVNDNMLPLICSVACVNGDFDGLSCFAEAWLRATHNGEPTGAAAVYMSSINQSWAPPMCAQDEFVDLLVSESYLSFGALCFAGSCQMMDEYGSDGVDMYDTWHIFGDPALRIRVSCLDAGTVALDRGLYSCDDTADVRVADCGLNVSAKVIDTVLVNVASDSEPAGEDIVLYETGPATAQFAGSIALTTTPGAGSVTVAAGDTLTATYIDADDGQGGTNQPVVTIATIDCTAPQISSVAIDDVQPRSATVSLLTDEPALAQVHYGVNCGALNDTALAAGLATECVVDVPDLQDATTYYFVVEALDAAGNSSIDDNGGACYSFTTPEVPDAFTEEFTASDPLDLDYQRLIFTPDGTSDFYSVCIEAITELPVDVSGATVLSLGDDDYESIGLATPVSLFGVDYATVHVGSNGYLTFTVGDTDYSETLIDHYDTPRVSAMFDDFAPHQGGAVSYQEMADRLVATYAGVPEYSAGNASTFQIEMFHDGVIALSYLSVSAADGIVGLSDGQYPLDYLEMNLSSSGDCSAGYAPGDTNCDGLVNYGDIDPFVVAITDAGDYGAANPDCDIMNADCNGDGLVNYGDIDAFVSLLSGS